MPAPDYNPVAVSRRISAPADAIFQVLADPSMHTQHDGSGMLRGAVSTGTISGLGDVFVMKMYYVEHGAYEMNNHVVDYELNRRIGWEPWPGRGHPAGPTAQAWRHRWTFTLVPDGPGTTTVTETYDCSRAPEDERASMADGAVWLDGMTRTLERLAGLCEPLPPAISGDAGCVTAPSGP
jgi:hypothetical protein